MTTRSRTTPNKSPTLAHTDPSDQWIQNEFAIAARNAEKNRSIKVPMGASSNSGRHRDREGNNAIQKSVQHTTIRSSPPDINITKSAPDFDAAHFRRTTSDPITRGERDALHRAVKSSSGAESPTNVLQLSIHNIVDDWSNAVKSLFSENRILHQDTSNVHPKSLILL